MKLIIDRNIWLRGEGNVRSKLLRGRDGKMCCIGIYGRALGVSDDDLLNINDVLKCRGEYPSWTNESNVIAEFYKINDDSGISDAHREAKLVALFSAQDIDAEFVN